MDSIQTVLLVAYLLIVLAMIAVILLQRSEGGGLGMGGSTGGLMTVRGSANLLTRTTAVLAALFFVTAIALTILSSLNRSQTSFLDNTAPASLAPGASAPAPANNLPSANLLDILQQQEASTAPAAPAADTASGENDQGLALPLNLALPQTSQPAATTASDTVPETPATTTPAAAAPTASASAPPDASAAPGSAAPASASAASQ